MRKSVGDAATAAQAAKISANAAEAAVDVARTSSQRQLRAYVTISECQFATTDTHWVVVGKFKNVGQTPAFDVQIRGNAFVGEYPIKEVPEFDFNINGISKTTLFPTEHLPYYEVGEKRPQAVYLSKAPDPAAFTWGNKNALWLVVEIRYLDTFGIEHSTRRCIHSGNVIAAINNWDNFHHYHEGNAAT